MLLHELEATGKRGGLKVRGLGAACSGTGWGAMAMPGKLGTWRSCCFKPKPGCTGHAACGLRLKGLQAATHQ